MNVVLIWNDPENLNGYLIKNPTEDQLRVLRAANGKMINYDECTNEMECISEALAKNPEDCGYDDVPEEWRCVWANCKTAFPNEAQVDAIFTMGFAW